jgi:uncharacterized membrane protein
MNSWLLIAIGFVLVLAGFLVPFLMALQVLEAGLVLSFSAHFLSLAGLVLAFYGTFDYVSSRQREDK